MQGGGNNNFNASEFAKKLLEAKDKQLFITRGDLTSTQLLDVRTELSGAVGDKDPGMLDAIKHINNALNAFNAERFATKLLGTRDKVKFLRESNLTAMQLTDVKTALNRDTTMVNKDDLKASIKSINSRLLIIGRRRHIVEDGPKQYKFKEHGKVVFYSEDFVPDFLATSDKTKMLKDNDLNASELAEVLHILSMRREADANRATVLEEAKVTVLNMQLEKIKESMQAKREQQSAAPLKPDSQLVTKPSQQQEVAAEPKAKKGLWGRMRDVVAKFREKFRDRSRKETTAEAIIQHSSTPVTMPSAKPAEEARDPDRKHSHAEKHAKTQNVRKTSTAPQSHVERHAKPVEKEKIERKDPIKPKEAVKSETLLKKATKSGDGYGAGFTRF